MSEHEHDEEGYSGTATLVFRNVTAALFFFFVVAHL